MSRRQDFSPRGGNVPCEPVSRDARDHVRYLGCRGFTLGVALAPPITPRKRMRVYIAKSCDSPRRRGTRRDAAPASATIATVKFSLIIRRLVPLATRRVYPVTELTSQERRRYRPRRRERRAERRVERKGRRKKIGGDELPRRNDNRV